MYIYNVTIKIQEDAHDRWVNWMKEKHIKQVLGTGKFSKALMCKLIENDNTEGVTYSIQYTTDNKKTLEEYYKNDSKALQEEGIKLFGGKFLAFRTELEVVDEILLA